MFKRKKSSPNDGRRTTKTQPSKNKAVFSYYQNRDVEFDASKARGGSWLEKLQQRVRHIPTLIALALIIISLLWAMSLSSEPRVTVVNEQNAATKAILRPQAEYQTAARRIMQQSPLTRNKLTLDTSGLERALQEQFPELTNVAIVLPIVSRTPVVYVQVAEPALLLDSGGQNFVIDEKGRALINAAQVGDLGALELIVVKDAAQLALQPGNQVLTGDDVRFMQTVRDQLTAKGLKVARMELPARAGAVNVFVEGKPYYIKFTTTGDALQQVGTFLALHQQLEGKKVTPGEYVDVRVEERAYYK